MIGRKLLFKLRANKHYLSTNSRIYKWKQVQKVRALCHKIKYLYINYVQQQQNCNNSMFLCASTRYVIARDVIAR